MKYILTVLLLFTISSAELYAECLCKSTGLKVSSPKRLSEINDVNFINELNDRSDVQETGCDLCGCFMGLDPNYSDNQIGVRYSSFNFFGADGELIVPESEPQTDHEIEPGVEYAEYYRNIELFGRYYITPKIRLFFNIPFSFNEIDKLQLNGMGDAKVFAQYQLYNTDMVRETNFWQRFFMGAGVKIPTGVYNKQLVYGIIDPHFQPGTGAFDLLLSASHLMKFEKPGIGFGTDIFYTVNGENKNGYRFANQFNVTFSGFYQFEATDFTFIPHAGIYFETAERDTQDDVSVNSSGGTAFFGTGGLDLYYTNYSLNFTIQLPITQNLYGLQPQNDLRFFIGTSYSF